MARTLSRYADDITKKHLRFDDTPKCVDEGKLSLTWRNSNGNLNEDLEFKAKPRISISNAIFSIITSVIIAIAIRWIYLKWLAQVESYIVDVGDDEELLEPMGQDTNWSNYLVKGFDQWMFVRASSFGLAVGVFTWMIIYMDSIEPGINPPTPLSPHKIRLQSGHSFHSGYIMAIVNGFVVFLIAIWYQWKKAFYQSPM